MIEILKAPAHLVVQDNGFRGQRHIGFPRAGAMDQAALALGNSLVGNHPESAAMEWGLSGGVIRFSEDAKIALTGAHVHGRRGRLPLTRNIGVDVAAGTTLEIDRFLTGRFLYIAVSPGLEIGPVLGSRSTYLAAGIGGFNGRRLKAGDSIPQSGSDGFFDGTVVSRPDYSQTTLRIIPGPQHGVLDGRLLQYITASEFRVSRTSDRTGYRLEGPGIDVLGLGQILSEPACEGAIQVTDSGTPIVLMADGPTIGGYNKIGVVIAEDLPILAQKTPGEKVRFALTRT
jgi:antagonist of KipI